MTFSILSWLKAFRNQRKVAHEFCTLTLFGLCVIGFVDFLYMAIISVDNGPRSGSKFPVGVFLGWVSFAVGAAGGIFSKSLEKKFTSHEADDLNITEEQRRVKLIGTTMLSCAFKFLVMVAAFGIASVAAGWPYGVHTVLCVFAGLSGVLALACIGYDLTNLYRTRDTDSDEREYAIHLEGDDNDWPAPEVHAPIP